MRRIIRIGLPLLAAGSVLTLATACSTDVSASRLQTDVAQTFARTFENTQLLTGKPTGSLNATGSCTRVGVHTKDAGAGSWLCMISYTDPQSGQRVTDTYGVGVDNTTCYTATNGALAQNPTVRSKTGQSVTDPLYQFDGCFAPYGN